MIKDFDSWVNETHTSIYKVNYDMDWGSRGSRRNLVWYTNVKPTYKNIVEFLNKSETYKNEVSKISVDSLENGQIKITLIKTDSISVEVLHN